MSDYIVKDTELTSVANAIRIKGGTNSQLVFPGGFVSAIGNISGGGGSWQTVFEGSVTTEEESGSVSGNIEGLTTLSGNSIKVTFNGTEYELPRNQYGYGAIGEQGPDFSENPLFISTENTPYVLFTETAGTYNLKVEMSENANDFSTAQVTINNTSSSMMDLPICCLNESNGGAVVTPYTSQSGESETVTVAIYKIAMVGFVVFDVFRSRISVSGNAEYDSASGQLVITGDCTITIS